ncbi:MAG: hypothetical protein IT345_04015 [Trueperaceae bacterium]|nr:hypothetical protein [Trueperaceae bacterium]
MTSNATGPLEQFAAGRLGTVEGIAAWLEGRGLRVGKLGENFAQQPLLCVQTGGGSAKPIVVTAGAHAGEPAGVLAALQLLVEHDFQAPTYFVPLRDPFAWQGFAGALLHASPTIELPEHLDHAAARALLMEHGAWHAEYGDLLVTEIGGIVFATMPPQNPPIGPRQLEQAVNQALASDQALVERTLGKRIVFPSNSGPTAEGVRDFDRAFSATVRTPGMVADMNRGFGGPEEPNEVRLLRELVDRLEPGLVLDLHEGQGSTYYAFVGADSPHEETYALTRAALNAMGQDGVPPVTLADLERSFGPRIREGLTEPTPGMLVGRVQNTALRGTSFGNYCDRFCAAITFETGRWAPLAERVHRQLLGAGAVLREHETGRR